jgi:ElaB/YqjD/DUF883 family membrane-anchored ribosome-binding protein
MRTQKSPEAVISPASQAPIENGQDVIGPLLQRATGQATAFANRSAEAVREGSRQARASALRAQKTTVNYVRNEPVKAMLLAAATGAALLALVNLATRARGPE